MARIKSYLDYGAFTPIQVAATAALNGPQDCVEEFRQLYKQRRDVLISGFAAAGVGGALTGRDDVRLGADPGTLSSISAVLSFPNSSCRRRRSRWRRALGSGSMADGFVRVAMVENEQRIRQASRNIKKFMSNADAHLGRKEAS